jgi:mycofactocin precursor
MADSDSSEPRGDIPAPGSRTPDAHGGETPSAEDHSRRSVEADLLVEDVSIDGMCGVY